MQSIHWPCQHLQTAICRNLLLWSGQRLAKPSVSLLLFWLTSAAYIWGWYFTGLIIVSIWWSDAHKIYCLNHNTSDSIKVPLIGINQDIQGQMQAIRSFYLLNIYCVPGTGQRTLKVCVIYSCQQSSKEELVWSSSYWQGNWVLEISPTLSFKPRQKVLRQWRAWGSHHFLRTNMALWNHWFSHALPSAAQPSFNLKLMPPFSHEDTPLPTLTTQISAQEAVSDNLKDSILYWIQ